MLVLVAGISRAQPANCILKPPRYTIHFGHGNVHDVNVTTLASYERVGSSCPSDGHYSFVPTTGDCFNGDWHTLSEDHTAGDNNGNMLLVNAAPRGGVFLSMPVNGLKRNTTYELGMWLMNLCRPTDKCPSLLLPSLNIKLQTPEGKVIANIVTRDLPRVAEPYWTQHRVYFTTPETAALLYLVMRDNAPGGCGNDFALDDITFRECVKQEIPTATPKPKSPSKQTAAVQRPKKAASSTPKKIDQSQITKPKNDTSIQAIAVIKQPHIEFPSAPMVLKNRENALVKRIEATAGEINISLYDNGVIDGDTVSIYHNNSLIRSHQRLSQKPINISLNVNASEPHHELVMVAENLGSIPPNTSIMIITTASSRYKVSISSSEQKNAKVVVDLKE
jgi:hypothetical protein